jgi:hypothetical protein
MREEKKQSPLTGKGVPYRSLLDGADFCGIIQVVGITVQNVLD